MSEARQKRRESPLLQTLQVRVTSDTQKIQYSDLQIALYVMTKRKFPHFGWHRTSFQAVRRYINYSHHAVKGGISRTEHAT